MADKTYSRVTEAETIIAKLVEKYPNVFWTVKPERITVLGIENKQRSDKNNVLAKIKPIRGVEKAVMEMNRIDVDYVIEIYWSDWNIWSQKLKKLIMGHELLHVAHEEGKTVKHDCEDFRIFLDAFGVDWSRQADSLPDILDTEIQFNIDLLPGLDHSADNTFAADDQKKSKEHDGKPDDDEGVEPFDPTEE